MALEANGDIDREGVCIIVRSDERHCKDPDRFDIERNVQEHLARGLGVQKFIPQQHCIEVGMSGQRLHTLFAKQEIHDVLSRYCRGLDRMDKEMAYSVWHKGATADYHGMYKGSGHGFIDWVWHAHAGMQCHSHQITNVLIEVGGDTAVSESYVTVALWTLPDERGQQKEMVGRGRYLDRWSCRDGVWAIDHREHVLDMLNVHDLCKGAISAQSTRDTNDPSFGFIKKF